MPERLEFSEFTFGFALTENFARRHSLRGVPVFPSLTQEGSPTGGYDVALDYGSGLPLLLQFKVPQVINRRSALMPDGFERPYYRAHLRCRRNDAGYSQHSVLLEHERDGYDVFYAVPRFHRLATLDECFTEGNIVESSAFFTPCDVGDLSDEPHHVAYCSHADVGWRRSNPVKLARSIAGRAFLEHLERRLDTRGSKPRFEYRALLDSMVNACERGVARATGTEKQQGRDRQGLGPDERLVIQHVAGYRRLPPREFADRLIQDRPARQAAALFARLWLNAELLTVSR